jgi:hypothetical protein
MLLTCPSRCRVNGNAADTVYETVVQVISELVVASGTECPACKLHGHFGISATAVVTADD